LPAENEKGKMQEDVPVAQVDMGYAQRMGEQPQFVDQNTPLLDAGTT
jgi:hypothetical protein